jgi:TetR/AcrR family transcriptional regulator
MERAERKEREYNMRRMEILSRAEVIFASKGFYKATVAEIAEASGFAVGTLYHFFENKEQLFAAMAADKIDLFYREIKEAVAKEKDVIGKIRALVNAHFRFVQNNIDFCAIFILRESPTLAEGNAALRDKMVADYLDYLAFIASFLSEGVKAGILKGKKPHLMAVALAGMLRSFTFAWMRSPESASLVDVTEMLLDIFLEGVKSADA